MKVALKFALLRCCGASKSPENRGIHNRKITMKFLQQIVCASALAAAASGGTVHAQPMQTPMQMPMPAAKPMAVEPTDGEVRKVDRKGGKITLKHGELRNLGMPPMAMQFEVKERKLIDKLKVGDKVRFKAVYEGGKYVVTEIRPTK